MIQKILFSFLFLFFVRNAALAQCPQLLDGQGVFSANAYWISCTGGNFTVFIQPNIAVGSYSIAWGDGSPNTTGTSIIPPATVAHTYLAITDTFNVTLTDISTGCVVTGVVVMEKTPTASIVIPIGDPVFGCAPASFNFQNNTQNVSQTTNFTWDFGDGSPILTFDETNFGQIISHVYLPGTVNCNVAVTLTAENYCNQGNPSINTFSPIQVWDIDNAQITASNTLLCYPDTIVSFTNTTQRNCFAQGNNGQRYEYWNFGNYWGQGQDSIVGWRPWGPPNWGPLTMAYPGIGTYNVMLVDSSFCGLDTAFITIQIVPPPTAAFTASDDTICAGQTVTFINLSSGGANQYLWNFGDGSGWNNLGGGNVTHTYTVAGDFTIKLVANITGGTASCTDTASLDLHVLPSPTADFIFNTNDGCDTLTVAFSNNSSADVITWSWVFNNGNASTLPNPPPQFYNTSGSYNVQLAVSNFQGCTDNVTKTIRVHPSPVPAFSPASVCMNEIASFTDLSTTILGEPIIGWNWDFGDGNSSTLQNPNHTYTSPGIFNIIFTVNTAFCSKTDTFPITVETIPTAAFTKNNTAGCSPLTVNFTNTSSANAVSFSWDFGDGNVSTATNPSHVFNNTSSIDTVFTIMLIAQTTFGCVDTTFQTVTVFPNPVATFTDNFVIACAPLIIDFTNTTTGAVSYSWNFGDGSPLDASVNPSHTYQNLTQFINNHTITLVATSLNGCTDTALKNISVFPEPQFGFSVSPDSGCSPLMVTFPSVIGAVVYNWDFGDGSPIVTGPTPSHLYINTTTNNVTYNVTLIATSAFGCSDTTFGSVLVFPNPTAQFTTNATAGCSPFPVAITNTSTGGSLFHWNMGDGTSFDTSVTNFNHVFFNTSTSSSQNNTIQLIVETDKGCKDTATQNITVFPSVIASFQSNLAGCSPFNAVFTNNSAGATNYSWDFGDGSPINNNTNPTHIYTNNTSLNINFTITLIAESSFGCFDTVQNVITVYPVPVASFIPTPFSQLFPSTVVGVSNTSSPGSWQYNWDFGDGNTSTQQAPPNNIYSTWGNYIITLIVSGANCADTFSQTIQIIPPVPVADFEGPAQGCRPVKVDFVNKSLYGTSYFWDFGDGGVSNQFSPSYTYFVPGIYTVTLTVTGPGGQDIEVKQQIIEVYDIPNAFFTFSPTTVFLPNEEVTFFNLSAFATTYLWNFGDGSTSNEFSPTHLYGNVGTFSVTLIASNANNCADTFAVANAVEAKAEGLIKIPNAFSPNTGGSNGGVIKGSGNNDVFHPIIVGADKYELNIFNKWGELLFVSRDVNIGWDGYYRDELSKQDVYIYKIKVTFINGVTETFAGDVTLLR